jgi:hypothetical protein
MKKFPKLSSAVDRTIHFMTRRPNPVIVHDLRARDNFFFSFNFEWKNSLLGPGRWERTDNPKFRLLKTGPFSPFTGQLFKSPRREGGLNSLGEDRLTSKTGGYDKRAVRLCVFGRPPLMEIRAVRLSTVPPTVSIFTRSLRIISN